jgi:hypothetical protein
LFISKIRIIKVKRLHVLDLTGPNALLTKTAMELFYLLRTDQNAPKVEKALMSPIELLKT